MANPVHVESIDALRVLRTALIKFMETSNLSLAEAESDLQKALNWLSEQSTHWESQIRKRQEALSRAQEALRMKRLFKRADGTYPSAVDEQKAVALAKRRLEEADDKRKKTKAWILRLPKEIQLYKGGVQRLSTTISGELPVAVARLDAMSGSLESYVALNIGDAAPTGDESTAVSTTEAPAMARAASSLPPGFPTLLPHQVAVYDRARPETYDVFESVEAARAHADNLLAERADAEATLFDAQARRLMTISRDGVS